MTQQFENMLYLFGANANGAVVEKELELNIDEIRKFSIEQGIWTMVYPELAKITDCEKYQQEFISVVSKGVMQKAFNLDIITKLEENGIKCCLVKGATLSPLYKEPDCRISGDADILIAEKDEAKVTKLLLEYGYDVEERPANHHHMSCVHKVGGLLEVHIRLYNELTKKMVFNDADIINEPWETTQIEGKTYHTLSIKDTLMYLTAHYIKHLINSGGGVRQMMDLLLYIEKNKDKIDFDEYDRILKELKYDKLIDVVKSVGGKYFGFNYEVKDEELMNKILTDTEEGGIFGFSAENRGGFLTEYCKKRTVMSNASSKIYVAVKREGGYTWFPSQESLINSYGYKYARYKILIPIAWIHRYIDVILGTRKPQIDKRNTDSFVNRMQMMRDLGMIDKE